MANPTFKITMENGGIIEGELYPEKAPQSVYNFISLANSGYYNGLIFHRVIPGFMIQGGCPEGTGMGGPGYCIKGEFFFNGIKNDLKHKRGVLSMARSSSPNSAGSQFFIMHQDAKHLDQQYAGFGKVKQDGYSLIPLEVYFKGSRVKVKVGLCKGKKLYDKRQSAAERDAKRQIDRAMKERY